jgi:hypothetical protein
MDDPDETREPNRLPYELDSEADLIVGADDGPDILRGVAEDEPELSTVELRETAFRTPQVGERLSDDELERDLE